MKAPSLGQIMDSYRAMGHLDAAELLIQFACEIEADRVPDLGAARTLRTLAMNIVNSVEEKKASWKQEGATDDHA
jgi:hypothetical protein